MRQVIRGEIYIDDEKLIEKMLLAIMAIHKRAKNLGKDHLLSPALAMLDTTIITGRNS